MFQPIFRLRFGFLSLLIITLLVVACNQAASPNATASPAIVLEACQLSSPGVPSVVKAECGWLQAYENRTAASGRTIDLHVAVVKATSRNPEPDPLFFLAGGPGQAATESYVQLAGAFNRINQKHDIVLVDQRGTGKSNPLDCPQLEDESGSEEDLAPYLRQCLDQLDADPVFYTTPMAMDDLEQVRSALGYEQINLYGVSYGTRAALTYLKYYPQNVRSVILDGVVPQDEVLGLSAAQDAQRTLDMIFDRCEADQVCSVTFPGVRDSFNDLMATLEQQPAEVSLIHPITGQPETLTLTTEMLGTGVRLLTYSQETIALLPLLIHTSQTRNDLSLLAAQYLLVSEELTESISEGMGYSVHCAEDIPFLDREQAEQVDQDAYLGDLYTRQLSQVCDVWPNGEVPAGYKDPVQSDVPVLLLSGEFDPVTPPENAEKTAQTLPNSLHLVVKGQGHNMIYRGCLPRVAASFIQSGSVQGLDTSCLTAIQPMPFFINFSGPNP